MKLRLLFTTQIPQLRLEKYLEINKLDIGETMPTSLFHYSILSWPIYDSLLLLAN